MPNRQDAPEDQSADARAESERPRRCETCEAWIVPTDWHPVVAEFDESDEFHLRAFCSEGCRDEWLDG